MIKAPCRCALVVALAFPVLLSVDHLKTPQHQTGLPDRERLVGAGIS